MPQPRPKKGSKTAQKAPTSPQKGVSMLVETINFEKGQIIAITPDMIIGDVVLAYPETLPILQKIGIHCVGCYASTFESIQEGVMRHGLDPLKVCKDLNKTIISSSHVRGSKIKNSGAKKFRR